MTVVSDPEIRTVSTELTKARYNRIAPLYNYIEAIPEMMFKPWRKRLLAKAKGKILETGVGTGKNFPHYPPGANVTGIDIAERMLVFSRRKASDLGLSFDLSEGDVQNLNFPDNSFDTAVATFVFCSVPEPVQGLRELRRVVKPSGRILLLEHVRIDKPIIGWLMDRMNPWVVRIMGANINRQTIENVTKAGLRIESVEHLGLMKMVKMISATKCINCVADLERKS
jgi:ubiquinone/menaquinone biosynthesis C-methylase UbiE